jgi:single stranded DNA-binding protein
MINRQDVAGHLGADATTKEIGENRFVVNFRVASTHRYMGKGNKVVEHTQWFNVRFYCSDRAVGYFRDRLLKGALVHASGPTKTDTYTGNDGQEKETTYVDCEPHNIHVMKEAKSEAKGEAPRESSTRSTSVGTRNAAPSPSAPASREQPVAPPSMARNDLMNFDA